jgi:hypothetical protein
MASKINEPGRSGGTVRARDFDLAGELINPENISSVPDLQAFRVSPISAGVVASLAFGEAR